MSSNFVLCSHFPWRHYVCVCRKCVTVCWCFAVNQFADGGRCVFDRGHVWECERERCVALTYLCLLRRACAVLSTLVSRLGLKLLSAPDLLSIVLLCELTTFSYRKQFLVKCFLVVKRFLLEFVSKYMQLDTKYNKDPLQYIVSSCYKPDTTSVSIYIDLCTVMWSSEKGLPLILVESDERGCLLCHHWCLSETVIFRDQQVSLISFALEFFLTRRNSVFNT